MQILKLIIYLLFTIIAGLIALPLLIILLPIRVFFGPLVVQIYSILSLYIFKVNIELYGEKNIPDKKTERIILIPNHVTFLDIFILSAIFRANFVSKIEIKYYPIIGQAAWLIGIIFLERSVPEKRHKLIQVLANHSRDRVIVNFPQGTTAKISEHIPFKRGIFKTVEINNNIILLPVTINYKEESQIAWKRKQSLLHNCITICRQKKIHARLKIHEPLTIKDYKNRTIPEICNATQEKVLKGLW